MTGQNMGTTNTDETRQAAPLPSGVHRREASVAGLVIIGPTSGPVDGFDQLFSCPSMQPVEARADRMVSWATVADEVIEVTRRASQLIRQGATAVVHLDSHRGQGCPVPPESREFVCARLAQIMIGLADVPGFVALHSERMARALILDSLGDDDVETVALTPAGYPVWELTHRTMFPGVPVAVCPGDRPVTAVGDMVAWFTSMQGWSPDCRAD